LWQQGKNASVRNNEGRALALHNCISSTTSSFLSITSLIKLKGLKPCITFKISFYSGLKAGAIKAGAINTGTINAGAIKANIIAFYTLSTSFN